METVTPEDNRRRRFMDHFLADSANVIMAGRTLKTLGCIVIIISSVYQSIAMSTFKAYVMVFLVLIFDDFSVNLISTDCAHIFKSLKIAACAEQSPLPFVEFGLIK